jgi:hypothetical protein
MGGDFVESNPPFLKIYTILAPPFPKVEKVEKVDWAFHRINNFDL